MEKTEKVYKEMEVDVKSHPRALSPHILILNIIMCVVGAIIGLELIVRTGVTPNTSIIGALFAIILSRIPLKAFQKYRSVHAQNIIQTSISGATFSAANCMILPIGIPVLMGRTDLMMPMLVGVFLATIIDATILYKCFDTEMFPAIGGLWSEMSAPMFICWILYSAFAAIASELIVGISAMHSGWFPGFATALIFLLVGMLLGFPALPLALMVGYTSATGPAFSDMAYDLKCGYILRGCGKDPELEAFGRKQQYIGEIISFTVAFVIVALMAKNYFDQGLFAPVNATFVATIEAGASSEVAKYLLLWAIPGAIIQLIGGQRQIGILFATGLLVGSVINGITILIALLIRYILVKINPENAQTLNILGAGALAGAALYSFFTATVQLGKKK